MKTTILGSCFATAFALGLFACAGAPLDEEGARTEEAASTQETAESEKTGETSAELRIGDGLGHGCALTCSGGDQTCCCDVGQKCVSGATYCECKVATDSRFNPGIYVP